MLVFNVANNVGFGDKKQTLWFGCSVYGKQAESTLVDYLKKGQAVFVTGELSQGGDKNQFLNVRVNSIDLVGSPKPEQTAQARPQPTRRNNAKEASDVYDDFNDSIPF